MSLHKHRRSDVSHSPISFKRNITAPGVHQLVHLLRFAAQRTEFSGRADMACFSGHVSGFSARMDQVVVAHVLKSQSKRNRRPMRQTYSICLSTCLCFLLVAASLPGHVARGQSAQGQSIHQQSIHSQTIVSAGRGTASQLAIHSQLKTHRLKANQDTATATPKSPSQAVVLSLGGTLILAPAYGAGLFVGPAIGHFYAENHSQAWIGIGVRSSMALIFAGAAESANEGDSGGVSEAPDFDGLGLLLFGAAVVLGSGIYDIATAGKSAREYNEKRGLQARVTPTAGGPGGKQVGLSVTVQF